MNKNYIKWSNVKYIIVICDEQDNVLTLEYKRFNTLYSRALDKEFWFNNTLTPYVYVGLCIFICTDDSTHILSKYEVIDIQERE